jgi:hypothetical protein
MQSIEDSNNPDETMRQWEISKNKEEETLKRKEEQLKRKKEQKLLIEKELIRDIFKPIRMFSEKYRDKPYSFMKEQGLLDVLNKLKDDTKKRLESSFKEGLISGSTYKYYLKGIEYGRVFMLNN